MEQRGLQTEAQLGEELGKSKHGEKCVFASRFIRDKIMYVFFFFIFRGEAKYNSQPQSDEEDLEPPLPLRSHDERQHYNPFVPPHHYMHNCGKEINKNIELFFFH